jgi:hypothetical protein
MSRYRLEIRPSVEKTLRKIRDAKLQRRLDDAYAPTVSICIRPSFSGETRLER